MNPSELKEIANWLYKRPGFPAAHCFGERVLISDDTMQATHGGMIVFNPETNSDQMLEIINKFTCLTVFYHRDSSKMKFCHVIHNFKESHTGEGETLEQAILAAALSVARSEK